jgi:hypothetical protein
MGGGSAGRVAHEKTQENQELEKVVVQVRDEEAEGRRAHAFFGMLTRDLQIVTHLTLHFTDSVLFVI